ncbi:MAG TPA: SRPBCC family protein [Chthoniobacteraceae bacterium]|jgi:phenylpropionate dioxygenase-like ring-hydroxylating dioxygenase large terminal subunit
MTVAASDFQSVFPSLAYANRTSSRTAQRPLALAEIQRQIVACGELPLSLATTIPAQAYTSEEFFEWENETLLRGGWQCVAHVSQIPEPGDFLNLDLLGEPIIVVRGKDRVVRVLSRVCPHRAMDIMPAGFGYDGHGPAEAKPDAPVCGHTRILLCPYHAWTFELDGKLKACPEMQQADSFVRDDFGLKLFRSEVWQGFVFVNLDGGAPALTEGLPEMAADLEPFRLEELQLVISREWDCPFNWKVLVENFMESYHHLGIHHQTLQPMMPARNTWTEQERRSYVRAHLPFKEALRETFKAQQEKSDFGGGPPFFPNLRENQKGEWGLFNIFPSFLLAAAPDRVIWYRLQPLGPDRLKLLTTVLLAPSVVARTDYPAIREQVATSLVDFHLEDLEVCTAVQRGLYASGWQPGRLSHLEMPVWLFHRYLAARIRGVWPTEDRPAAPSQRT